MPTKPKKNQPQTPNINQHRDNFYSPSYSLDILLPFIPKNITTIFECAAGNGKIVDYFVEKGYNVIARDVVGKYEYSNFLEDWQELDENTMIVTNPPFSCKYRFYERCMKYFKDYNVTWALLIPLDYSKWLIDSIRYNNCEKIIPDSRINYITPNGKSGKDSSAQFHSGWLTHGLQLGKTETFVSLTKEMKENV